MKKLIKLVTITICMCGMFSLASCSAGKENAENVKNTETSASSQENSDKENTDSSAVSDDETSLPDRNSLQTVPDNAVNVLNDVIEQSKTDFKDEKGKKLYGYQGKQKINNIDCHIFVVCSEKDNNFKNLGTYASVVKTREIYKLDASTNKFVKCEGKDKTQQLSWADTETESFAKYLSADKEKSVQNNCTSNKNSASSKADK